MKIKKKTQVIVVGSGPAGATVAREMAKAGKKVILVERGKDWRKSPLYGTYLGCLLYTDKGGLLFSEEGLNIIRGIMTGGSTNLYCGTAAKPPEWLKDKYKVDIDKYVDETINELNIKPLPKELIGEASRRCLEAAQELGLNWELIPKFMNPDRCKKDFNCGAKCMLGCKCGAKWTANEYIDEAVKLGAELILNAEVKEVLISEKQATGIRGKVNGRQPFEIEGDIVVLSAGGLGTPIILQNSGFYGAGRGLLIDPTIMVYGVYKGKGTYLCPPMAIGSYDDTDGYILSHLIDPYLLFPIIMLLKGIRYPFRLVNYKRMMGIMIKVKDEIAGGITMEGRISKPMTERDRYRLNHASNVARKILLKAGCDEDSIIVTPIRGTHPSGTVRIGEMIDKNLQTAVKNLFICDASVLPEALDRPVVLTIIGLGKYLSEYIFKKVYED
ncbi:MAG: hypothetical protein COS84_08125 [Armatimonadetes bacterium CG07_land_8_20_14_0_80_40_9]|nr:MAG: hypothetical protein COS84_08125 [Armatimonadetes bacterium CG07_land_8_20_14_0_80_40_9]